MRLRPAKEKDIQSAIHDLLDYRLAWTRRINGGAVSRAMVLRWLKEANAPAYIMAWVSNLKRPPYIPFHFGRKDMTVLDLIGQSRSGQFVTVEVKRPGEKLKETQSNTIEIVRAGGGIAFCADSVDDADRQLKDQL